MVGLGGGVSTYFPFDGEVANRRSLVVAVASVCGFYIHKPIPLYTAAKQYVSSYFSSAEPGITH